MLAARRLLTVLVCTPTEQDVSSTLLLDTAPCRQGKICASLYRFLK